MTDLDGGPDERPMEIAMYQLRVLRRRERTNMLNETKVRRMAREAGLDELADAIEDRRYYELLERYRTENRLDDG